MINPIHNKSVWNNRKRKLKYRAWHRGFREMDDLLGKFADSHLEDMEVTELDDFDMILGLPDPSLYNWLTGREEVPDEYKNNTIFLKLVGFTRGRF